jgi:uncharacterized protein with ParB-like and HNH nuclease domain
MNEIRPRTIDELIRNKNTKGNAESYFIPSYQRGYRWNEYQVLDLLNDINDFMNNRDSDFYCLQPVVVKGMENGSWELVDGQQRLTTIYIILHYLNEVCYDLEFEKRPTSKKFLSELSKLIDEDESVSNPDYYFIRNAYKTIKQWFEDEINKGSNNRLKNKFSLCLMEDVQVIWYCINDLDSKDKTDPRKVFSRLNTGKIPLTDSELIKAKLLQNLKLQNAAQAKLIREAKEKGDFGTFEQGINERQKAGRASSIRQAELAGEWDRIEQALQENDFWLFLTDSEEYNYSARIEFIFRLIADKSDLPYGIFRYFNNRIDISKENVSDIWKEIKDYFQTLQGWYHNRELYHLVGFLLANKASIKELHDLSIINTKKDFIELIKKMISESLSSVQLHQLKYKNRESITQVLLLFNVMSIQESENTTARFPFHLYKGNGEKKNKWSLEHIHAQESKNLKSEDAMRNWLVDAQQGIASIIEITEEPQDVKEIPAISKTKLLTEIKQTINTILKSTKVEEEEFKNIQIELIQIFNSGSVHDIENMALLQCGDNAALGNQIFPVKRNKIIELEKNGAFIPLCTRNVFLKYYTKSPSQPYFWSRTDKDAYFEELKERLESYLPIQIKPIKEKEA